MLIFTNVTGSLQGQPFLPGMGGFFSTGGLVLGVLTAMAIAILLVMLIETLRGQRQPKAPSRNNIRQMLIALLGTLPPAMAIYLLPGAAGGFTWKQALQNAPDSFATAIMTATAFLVTCNLIFLASLLLPYKDTQSVKHKYIKPLPLILFLGFISGIANAAAMFLISTSFFSPLKLEYLITYFLLALTLYVYGQKIVRTKMIVIANTIVYELRMKLITKIFTTRFQDFEKIDSGRVYSTLNNDTEAISDSAGTVVGVITSSVTAAAAFVYLSAISLTATLATLAFAVLMGIFYVMVGRQSRQLMEQMRNTQDAFMKLVEGLVNGFKEISLHHNKKREYEADIDDSCNEYRRTRVSARVKFVNANLVSSSMILVLLATICIVFPRLLPDLSLPRLISFIMVLLYMVGPVTGIMASLPAFVRIKVSWDRIRTFLAEIPAMHGVTDYKLNPVMSRKGQKAEIIEAQQVYFQYPGAAETNGFAVGPIDVTVKGGEILFLVGGNGSGKTTLAKLLTGLYMPQQGAVKINGQPLTQKDHPGEYFSVVFGDFHLFQKLYNVDLDARRQELEQYLDILGLKDKVRLENGRFSTLNLSGGQKKRLALLQCYLEDCPIYLFDEVAADQDPEFRRFFYHRLLPQMKERGKIVIAITHDDHYFDVADQIIKLDMGKIDPR